MLKKSMKNPEKNLAKMISLVTQLTQVILKESGTIKVSDMVQCSLRILGSQMNPSMEMDEFLIAQTIRKKINKGSKTQMQTWLTFEDLFGLFQNKRLVISQKSSILYLLYSLNRLQKNTSVDDIRNLSKIEMLSLTERESPPKQPDIKELHFKNMMLSNDIPEQKLLQDLIYVLQDIPGELITFNKEKERYTVSKNELPGSVQNIVSRIAELGWMYRRVFNYIDTTLKKDGVELIEQSFCSALQQELTDYYRLIAVLESQINESKHIYKGPNVRGKNDDLSSHFTLHRFYIWIQDPLKRLKLMAMITDSVKGLKGGALASAVGAHIRHGDSFVRSFVRRLMHKLCQPIFHMVERWVTVGELKDPFEEFFIAVHPLVPMGRLWQEKYSLRKAMIPSFIDEKLANTILVTGKSINFIRYRCEDAGWITEYNFTFNPIIVPGNEKQTIFEKEINEVAEVTNVRLMELLRDKFKLKQHCEALKKYLLLSQGDFIQILMDTLEKDLAKDAKELFEHNLRSRLTAAIQKSNVQYEDPAIIERLEVKKMVAKKDDHGWDVFSLDYRIDPPLDVVFTSEGMKIYLRIFKFLWSVKRVEHILTNTWMLHTHQAHILKDHRELEGLCRKSYLLRNEMIHFVRNLHSYIMFEVLECAWKDLCDGLESAKNLDDVLHAHKKYLNEIQEKALLGGERNALGDKNELFSQLKKLFQHIIKLGDVQKNACYNEVFGVTHRKKKNNKEKKKDFDAKQFERIDSMIEVLNKKYRGGVNKFFEMLNGQKDLQHRSRHDASKALAISRENLGFLSYRLDFNEFYKNQLNKRAKKSKKKSIK